MTFTVHFPHWLLPALVGALVGALLVACVFVYLCARSWSGLQI